MITEIPKRGDTYFFRSGNWAIISDSSNPQYSRVTIVTLDNKDIWYRVNDDITVKTTSIDRFMEVVLSDPLCRKETSIEKATRLLDEAFGLGIESVHDLIRKDSIICRIYQCVIHALTEEIERNKE